MTETDKKLIAEAKRVREFAYCPYSHFAVGAAVLGASGEIYGGCNIENASFSVTNCAERTAIFKAISAGEDGIENAVPRGIVFQLFIFQNHDDLFHTCSIV